MTGKKKLKAGELGKYFIIFIIPALVIYLVFSITPFLYTMYYSFTDYTDTVSYTHLDVYKRQGSRKLQN